MKKKHINIAIIAGSLLIILVAGYIIAPVHSVKVTGSSMEPTIRNNQRVFVYETTDIKKGDVVLIESKRLGGETGYLVKRVEGMSGDTIHTTDDMVVLDDDATTIEAGTPIPYRSH